MDGVIERPWLASNLALFASTTLGSRLLVIEMLGPIIVGPGDLERGGETGLRGAWAFLGNVATYWMSSAATSTGRPTGLENALGSLTGLPTFFFVFCICRNWFSLSAGIGLRVYPRADPEASTMVGGRTPGVTMISSRSSIALKATLFGGVITLIAAMSSGVFLSTVYSSTSPGKSGSSGPDVATSVISW